MGFSMRQFTSRDAKMLANYRFNIKRTEIKGAVLELFFWWP
jgi:hypothetical protein